MFLCITTVIYFPLFRDPDKVQRWEYQVVKKKSKRVHSARI